jgi:hypothetical protein
LRRATRRALFAVFFVPALLAPLAAVRARAEEGPARWPSLRGSGLITLPDAGVLDRGRVLAGIGGNNRDRDPLGMDVLDGSLLFAAGLGARLEAYGEVVLSRVAAMPELPVLPPPLLDLVVAPGAAAPPRPHYAIYAPIPYVNKRGRDRFDDFVPGDAALGVKLRLADAAGARPALAVAGEVTLPLTRDLANLQSGAGTGATDLGARLTAEWGGGPTRLVASLLYTRTGDPPFGDRLVDVAAGARVEDRPLELPDRIEAGAGVRHAIGARVAAVAEAVALFEVGARTATVDAAPPLDVLGGLQAAFSRVRLTAALRYHARSLPSGDVRPSPVAGLVDITDVAPADQSAWLTAVGAGAAVPALRERSQRLVAVRSAVALPPGARVVPETYAIRSEHQVGFVVVVAFAF